MPSIHNPSPSLQSSKSVWEDKYSEIGEFWINPNLCVVVPSFQGLAVSRTCAARITLPFLSSLYDPLPLFSLFPASSVRLEPADRTDRDVVLLSFVLFKRRLLSILIWGIIISNSFSFELENFSLFCVQLVRNRIDNVEKSHRMSQKLAFWFLLLLLFASEKPLDGNWIMHTLILLVFFLRACKGQMSLFFLHRKCQVT